MLAISTLTRKCLQSVHRQGHSSSLYTDKSLCTPTNISEGTNKTIACSSTWTRKLPEAVHWHKVSTLFRLPRICNLYTDEKIPTRGRTLTNWQENPLCAVDWPPPSTCKKDKNKWLQNLYTIKNADTKSALQRFFLSAYILLGLLARCTHWLWRLCMLSF